MTYNENYLICIKRIKKRSESDRAELLRSIYRIALGYVVLGIIAS